MGRMKYLRKRLKMEASCSNVTRQVREEFDAKQLPLKLFANDRYPHDGRINSNSKPEYLFDIVEALEGSSEFDYLKNSCFGPLFDLPVHKCSLSGRLVHSMLCRALHTKKNYEMWFVFGGQPFRFSLREFAIITGLPCRPYPDDQSIQKWQNPLEGEEPYWYKLIGSEKTVNIQEIVDWLKMDKRLPESEKMAGWRKLRLALVVIVEGILVCNLEPSMEVVEMVKDLNSFEAYPWGRKSFELTLKMVKVGSEVKCVDELVGILMQSRIAICGFTLAFQLLALRCIPLLDDYLPVMAKSLTFLDQSVVQVTKMRTKNNANILSAENHANLIVIPILPGECSMDFNWVDEVEDLSVDYLLKTIENGHTFAKNDWLGGCERLPIIVDKSSSLKTKTPKRDSEKDQRSQLAESSKESPTTDIAGMMKEIDRKSDELDAKILRMLAFEKVSMKNEIVEEVLRILGERNLRTKMTKNTYEDICEETVDLTQKETEKNCPIEDLEDMTGKESSDHPDGSGKKKISPVDTAERSDLFGYDFLVTEHGILKENHETLKKDYEILQETFKLEKEVSEALKVHQKKETKKLGTKLERLVKDLAKEKSEKEELKKEMERMKSKTEKEEKELKKMKDKYGQFESEKEELKKEVERMQSVKEDVIKDLRIKNQELLTAKEKELKQMKNRCGELEKNCESEQEEFKKKMEKIESENEATINNLKIKNQKLVIAREELEEELKKLENKYVELSERYGMLECSYLKLLYEAEKLNGLGGNDVALKKEVIEVGDHNVNNAITGPIIILDDSDAESDNPASKSDKIPQRSVDIKQKQQFDVPNSSKVSDHLPSSSSSSSSSDEFVIMQRPFKRARV